MEQPPSSRSSSEIIPESLIASSQEPPTQSDEAYERLSGVVARPTHHVGRKILVVFIGLAFAGGVGVGTYAVLDSMRATVGDQSSAKASTEKSSTTAKVAATNTDAAITTSMTDIDRDMTQATTDQADADSAVSDSDSQITVPTE